LVSEVSGCAEVASWILSYLRIGKHPSVIHKFLEVVEIRSHPSGLCMARMDLVVGDWAQWVCKILSMMEFGVGSYGEQRTLLGFEVGSEH
jgi:hypothetical protein